MWACLVIIMQARVGVDAVFDFSLWVWLPRAVPFSQAMLMSYKLDGSAHATSDPWSMPHPFIGSLKSSWWGKWKWGAGGEAGRHHVCFGVFEGCVVILPLFVDFWWASSDWSNFIENGLPWGTEWCCCKWVMALPSFEYTKCTLNSQFSCHTPKVDMIKLAWLDILDVFHVVICAIWFVLFHPSCQAWATLMKRRIKLMTT